MVSEKQFQNLYFNFYLTIQSAEKLNRLMWLFILMVFKNLIILILGKCTVVTKKPSRLKDVKHQTRFVLLIF